MSLARRAASARRLSAAAPVFTALGDPTRLRLVTRLCDEGPLSIARLTDGTTLTRQAVTKHLRVLEGAGLAASGRQGREQQWRIEAARVAEVRRLLGEIAAQWEGALARLKRTLETPPG